ncbi:hypothetical protein [Candidatus Nitrosotenuis sp. DW1]|uniref:hypothetical protein n=1 Tax=Candidatus Nitrosotenuis sp. DW1 TaxID=2259672 RepID=UPI0015C7B90A|nr:hypothetical protein [Candidatus Nitrosotenuis sp. DW1]
MKILVNNQKKTAGHKMHLGIVEYLDFLLKETKKINPTIRNVATVAKIISENKYFKTKSQLNKKLPKAMQYPTFNFILNYLQKTNMIQINPDGSIVWIYPTSQKLKKRIREARPL